MALSPSSAEAPQKWSGVEPWKQVGHTPGAYPSSASSSGTNLDTAAYRTINQAVKARRAEYVCRKNVTIKVGTWNTASVSGTAKDLGGWFVGGLGVKGLTQDLSGATLGTADRHSNTHIESVEEQEARARKKSCTLPKYETAVIASDEEVGLYVLGLQEVVDISSVTEAIRPFYDPNPAKRWKQAVTDALPAGYEKVVELQLLGLLILVYAAPSVAPQITSVDASSVGTGALGYMGNKGAVSVRMVLGGTTRLLFVNSHLAAGAQDADLTRRIWDTNQILTRTKFAPAELDGEVSGVEPEVIGDEDFAFWFGDLNFRLDDIPGEDVRRLLLLHTRNEYDIINKSKRKIDSELGYINAPLEDANSHQEPDDHDEGGRPAKESSIEPALDPENDPASLLTTLTSLLSHDQLRAQQKLGTVFHEGWREGHIGFLPTYKYDIGSVGMFDSGEKKRSPSWCDRILYRTRRDRLEYQRKSRELDEAKKKDQDLKARGIDAGVADQEVLFEYDPENDGVEDNEDEPATDQHHDPQTVVIRDGFEDTIRLEDYVSHQRVLSSDHKPLSAVFVLTYDAVIPDLKTKISQEVTKEFDRSENEGRPGVTVVVENSPGHAPAADNSIGGRELNTMVFDRVRYLVHDGRTVTIANTSPTPVTFAFINRPAEQGCSPSPAPLWLSIHINHEQDDVSKSPDELESAPRFTLQPGEVATADVTIHIDDPSMVKYLNCGAESLDDVLILRVLGGRDYFIRVTGTWLPSCFFREVNELIQHPHGVRQGEELSSTRQAASVKRDQTYQSAPNELFTLTEAIPRAVERATADWPMLHASEDGPWIKNHFWPFESDTDWTQTQLSSNLTAVRDAIDTGSLIDDHLDVSIDAVQRIEAIAKTLLDFLSSLQDGIIPTTSWATIDEQIVASEKANTVASKAQIHEVVLDALSAAPIHSVCFTFIAFMLTRLISELGAASSTNPFSPSSPQAYTAAPSNNITEAASEPSSTPIESPRSKLSFLPSLTRKRSNFNSAVTSPISTRSPLDRRKAHVDAYVEKLAPIIIRAEQDATVKGKEKKTLEARKRKVLAAFIDENV